LVSCNLHAHEHFIVMFAINKRIDTVITKQMRKSVMMMKNRTANKNELSVENLLLYFVQLNKVKSRDLCHSFDVQVLCD